MTTCRGRHDLEIVFRDGPEIEETVVRWCSRCGAVTVDIDSDGRTSPGTIMSMRLPDTEAERQGRS